MRKVRFFVLVHGKTRMRFPVAAHAKRGRLTFARYMHCSNLVLALL